MLHNTLKGYFASLYQQTMSRAYQEALDRVAASLAVGGLCLDCGAGDGGQLAALRRRIPIANEQYVGLEWDPASTVLARANGLQIIRADLNQSLPFDNRTFQCVFALSVLEHLIFGCRFLQEAYRVLAPGGHLIIVTPNLSAWFNIFLLVLGRMPSSGPHPDSVKLTQHITPIHFRDTGERHVEDDVPVDRHLVVFTYRTLKEYLGLLRFQLVESRAFGLYPFPGVVQPILERMDPWHCHQVLFDCRR